MATYIAHSHSPSDDEKISSSDSQIDIIQGDLNTLDVGLALIVGQSDDEARLSAEESMHLCRKIDRHLLPLLCLIYTGKSLVKLIRFWSVDMRDLTVQFIDK